MQLPLHGTLPEPTHRPRFALAAKGFRPFFFGAAAFATLIVPIWLLVLGGVAKPGTYLDPVAWHAHEMIFGFTTAVIAGFLLTAVANWTQRETLTGPPLLALAGLWLAGRVAMLVPSAATPVIDIAFLPALGIAIARPLVAARNRRNFVMLAVLGTLTAANVAVHFGDSHAAMRVAIDVIVFLMLVIAGRIIPMFTRNATKAEGIVSVPALDRLTAIAAALLVAADVALPDTRIATGVAVALAVVAIARAARWGTRHTLKHPLLWILHAGYAWIPIGLLLRAFGATSALHALTVGAIGSLTLGMMARVTLGHTGRLIEAAPTMFVAITLAAIARVFLPLVTTQYLAALIAAGALWTFAFALYVAKYTPYLFTARPDGKAG